MQSTPTMPYIPAAPERVIVKNHWTGVIVASAVAVLVALAGTFMYVGASSNARDATRELVSVTSDLKTARSDLDRASTDLASTKTTLSDTRATLSDTRNDLRTSRAVSQSLAECSVQMFRAWYATVNYSYAVTGAALENAVYSAACESSGAAYRSSNGGLA